LAGRPAGGGIGSQVGNMHFKKLIDKPGKRVNELMC